MVAALFASDGALPFDLLVIHSLLSPITKKKQQT
jgi:hypothetical protein